MKIRKTMLIAITSGFFVVVAAQAQAAVVQQGRSTMHRGHYHHPTVLIHRHHHPHPLMHRQPKQY